MRYKLHTIGYHDTDCDVPAHQHAQAECILPLEGSCLIHCAAQQYMVAPGQCLYMPAGTVHDQVHPGPGINYYIKVPQLEEQFGDQVQLIDLQQDQLLLRWCADLHQCVDGQEADMQPIMDDICNALIKRLAQLARIYADQAAYAPPLRRALTYMQKHYTDELQLDEIAAAAGISVSHLGLLFRSQFRHSVMSHLQEMRMRQARRLLLDDYRQIADVASSCGYPDASYFARQFRRCHGQSPRQWRRQHNA